MLSTFFVLNIVKCHVLLSALDRESFSVLEPESLSLQAAYFRFCWSRYLQPPFSRDLPFQDEDKIASFVWTPRTPKYISIQTAFKPEVWWSDCLTVKEGEISVTQIFKNSVGKTYHFGDFWCVVRAKLQCIIFFLSRLWFSVSLGLGCCTPWIQVNAEY